MILTLPVTKRKSGSSAARTLLRSGSIPAVVYGAHHSAESIAVDARAFEKVFRAAGEATIVALDGLDAAALPTLIHEVDIDPTTRKPRHIDFYAVTKGEKVQVSIPLSFIGESPAVVAGANLVKVLHELEVEADPMNLPQTISVDLSVLAAIGDQIHAKDLALPEGVTLVDEPEEVVALTQEVKEEKEEPVVAAPEDLSSIEVEKKGKEEVPEEGVPPQEKAS